MPLVPKNNAESTVADNPLTAGTTTLNVANGEGVNFPSTFPYNLTIWDADTYEDPGDDSNMEIVRCTAKSTDALTIVRGQEGTSGVEHAQGQKVALLITAGVINSYKLFDAVVDSAGGTYTSIAAAFVAGAKSVFVRNGTYTETADIDVPAGGVLIGESMNGTIIDFNSSSSYEINLGSGSIMENLTVQDNSKSAGAIVGATSSANIKVRNVVIDTCAKFLTVADNFNIVDCKFTGFTGTALEISGSNSICRGCYFNGGGNSAVAISVITGDGHGITNNTIIGQFDTGIYVNGSDEVFITGNNILPSSGNVNYGIRIEVCVRVLITGNFVEGFTGTPGAGYYFKSDVSKFGLVNNSVTGCDIGIDWRNTNDGLIVCNIAMGNTTWGDGTGCSNVTETNNLT